MIIPDSYDKESSPTASKPTGDDKIANDQNKKVEITRDGKAANDQNQKKGAFYFIATKLSRLTTGLNRSQKMLQCHLTHSKIGKIPIMNNVLLNLMISPVSSVRTSKLPDIIVINIAILDATKPTATESSLPSYSNF